MPPYCFRQRVIRLLGDAYLTNGVNPCLSRPTSTSTCRSFETISSGVCRLVAIFDPPFSYYRRWTNSGGGSMGFFDIKSRHSSGGSKMSGNDPNRTSWIETDYSFQKSPTLVSPNWKTAYESLRSPSSMPGEPRAYLEQQSPLRRAARACLSYTLLISERSKNLVKYHFENRQKQSMFQSSIYLEKKLSCTGYL